jgi:hypothetical protein
MKNVIVALMTGAVVVATGSIPSIEAAQQPPPAQQPSSEQQPGTRGTTGAAKAVVPPPIAVKVIAVDPGGKTITVRDIAVVAAPPAKAVEVKLPVTANATGQKLGDTKAGETVEVTCEVKPTVHPEAGVPIVLTDCVRVIKIDPKS